MKKLNRDLNKEIVALFTAIMIALAAITVILYLYFFNFYPVYIDGKIVISRKIIRYGMYLATLTVFVFSVIRAIKADDKIKRLLVIKKNKIRKQ